MMKITASMVLMVVAPLTIVQGADATKASARGGRSPHSGGKGGRTPHPGRKGDQSEGGRPEHTPANGDSHSSFAQRGQQTPATTTRGHTKPSNNNTNGNNSTTGNDNTDPEQVENEKSGLATWILIVIIAGGVLAAAVLGICICCCCCAKSSAKSNHSDAQSEVEMRRRSVSNPVSDASVKSDPARRNLKFNKSYSSRYDYNESV